MSKFMTFTNIAEEAGDTGGRSAVVAQDVKSLYERPASGHTEIMLYGSKDDASCLLSNEPFDVILDRLEHILAEDN